MCDDDDNDNGADIYAKVIRCLFRRRNVHVLNFPMRDFLLELVQSNRNRKPEADLPFAFCIVLFFRLHFNNNKISDVSFSYAQSYMAAIALFVFLLE